MPWRHMGEWKYSSSILDCGTIWRCVISFMSGRLYRQAQSLRYPMDRTLGWAPEWIRKNLLPLLGIKPCPSCHHIDWTIPAPIKSTDRKQKSHFYIHLTAEQADKRQVLMHSNIPSKGNQGCIHAWIGTVSVIGFHSSTSCCILRTTSWSRMLSNTHGGTNGSQCSKNSISGSHVRQFQLL
jgi:hypothetical protein